MVFSSALWVSLYLGNNYILLILYFCFFRNCYQFNTIQRQRRTGQSGGLEIELFVGIIKNLELLTKDVGLAVFIHSSTMSPLSIQPIKVPTNLETSIVVTKINIEKLSQPYSTCQDLDRFKSELKELILNQGFKFF